MNRLLPIPCLIIQTLLAFILSGEIRTPVIIGNNMVLQQNHKKPIWGWGNLGELIRVQIAEQNHKVEVSPEGYWKVSLGPMPASASPKVMTIQGSSELKFENILVGEAVIIDVGESRNIHPRNKQIVANRLVSHALAKDYGMDLPHQSPRYQSMETKGNKIILNFDHVGQGLYCFDVPEPKGFAICGEDQKFVWAQTTLVGKDKVEVWAEGIENPVAARYAREDNPVCNLYRNDGLVTLPVTPFHTDDFPMITFGL